MKEIYFIYTENLLNQFLTDFLSRKNIKLTTDTDCHQLFSKASQINADLMILNKNITCVDLNGFFVRKELIGNIKNIPVFLLGNFTPEEIQLYKKYNVKAFISLPVNPYALQERIIQFLNIPQAEKSFRTPMMTDININRRIFIIQIEGNLEPDKMDILNYKIRHHCHKAGLKSPKFFFIFPSLYEESITKENLSILFNFLNYKELAIKPAGIKILTKNEIMLQLINEDKLLSQIKCVNDYLTGIRLLNIDFDKSQQIPVSFLKKDSQFILNLYNNQGEIIIPAKKKITEALISSLIDSGIHSLNYYSDNPITELLDNDQSTSELNNEDLLELEELNELITHQSSLEEEHDFRESDQSKMVLFFNKLKGLHSLIISNKTNDYHLINSVLNDYLTVEYTEFVPNIIDFLSQKKYILIFLDNHLVSPRAIDYLLEIRKTLNRRQISIVIISDNINKLELDQFKRAGTDYVLVRPVSKYRLLQKVHNFLIQDRQY